MSVPDLDADILSGRVAGCVQSGQDRVHGGVVGRVGRRARTQQTERNRNGLLPLGGERRDEEAASQVTQECASVHRAPPSGRVV